MKKNKDRNTISNDWHEVKYAAKAWGVHPWQVYQAKHETSSRRRVVLRSWIEENILKQKTAEDAVNDELPHTGI